MSSEAVGTIAMKRMKTESVAKPRGVDHTDVVRVEIQGAKLAVCLIGLGRRGWYLGISR